MFPLLRGGNCRQLVPGHSMYVAWSRQESVTSQPIWCTIDWLGTRQYRELERLSRSKVLLWLLTSPQASPEPSNHRRGWVCICFWHHIHGFSPNHPIPNTQQASHCPLISDTISVESGPMPRLRYQECPDFRGQPCVLELSCFWTSDWNSKIMWLQVHGQKLNQTSD